MVTAVARMLIPVLLLVVSGFSPRYSTVHVGNRRDCSSDSSVCTTLLRTRRNDFHCVTPKPFIAVSFDKEWLSKFTGVTELKYKNLNDHEVKPGRIRLRLLRLLRRRLITRSNEDNDQKDIAPPHSAQEGMVNEENNFHLDIGEPVGVGGSFRDGTKKETPKIMNVGTRKMTKTFYHSGSIASAAALAVRRNLLDKFASRWRRDSQKSDNAPAAVQASSASAPIVVNDVHELRDKILNGGMVLEDIEAATANVSKVAKTLEMEATQSHEVMKVISHRVRTKSLPGNRRRGEDRTVKLALAIEGGGMRGAVSAGMAAAVASLGLCDAFDAVYGSSAGCVVGAYMVSRQMCVDVYTEVLTAAKKKFVCKRRVMGGLAATLANDLLGRIGKKVVGDDVSEQSLPDSDDYDTDSLSLVGYDGTVNDRSYRNSTSNSERRGTGLLTIVSRMIPTSLLLRPDPGMNISFVLDGIMSSDGGLRPFDMEAFQINDKRQPLRVVSSTVLDGKMETVAFGSAEGDFFPLLDQADIPHPTSVTSKTGFRRKRHRRSQRFRPTGGLRLLRASAYKAKGGAFFLLRHAVPWKRGRNNSNVTSRSVIGPGRELVLDRIGERQQRIVSEEDVTSCPDGKGRGGFFGCLEASMTVPGATGPPVKLLRCNDRMQHNKKKKSVHENGTKSNSSISKCFDAFCYEPIPYRSAVEEGATHVLVLRSRPEGCTVETKPGVYEKVIAPLYFRTNGLPEVATYFEKGGQQYRYLEDILTLQEGLAVGCNNGGGSTSEYHPLKSGTLYGEDSIEPFQGVMVPPTRILYGLDDDASEGGDVKTTAWKRAHLLPIAVPEGTDELPQLSQDKDEVIRGVREGYAAAFDVLAPVAGLDLNGTGWNGRRVAELIFPKQRAAEGGGGKDEEGDADKDDAKNVLETPIAVKGDAIASPGEDEEKLLRRLKGWLASRGEDLRMRTTRIKRRRGRRRRRKRSLNNEFGGLQEKDTRQLSEADKLLASLPGFQSGRLTHLAGALIKNQTAFV